LIDCRIALSHLEVRREEVLRRIRFQVKSRRTSGAVAGRFANITIGTLTEVIDAEARVAVEDNVERILDNMFNDIGDE